MGKWLFLLIFLGIGGYLVVREVLAIGAERREGRDPRRLYPRFRRRTKGVVLLILLYSLAAFFETIARTGAFTLREGILYLGIFLCVLVWLLILAARDIRSTAQEALAERHGLTLESLLAMEEEIRQLKSKGSESKDERRNAKKKQTNETASAIRSSGRQRRAMRRKRRK